MSIMVNRLTNFVINGKNIKHKMPILCTNRQNKHKYLKLEIMIIQIPLNNKKTFEDIQNYFEFSLS